MRHGVPTSREPADPAALYFRCMFHEFFYGPFADEAALVAALRTLDRVDPMWDYDCFAIHRGDPASKDWVTGLPFVTDVERERIEAARRAPAVLRFGPITERELDIAESTFRAMYVTLEDMLKAGIPLDLIRTFVLEQPDVRERLRRTIEAAQ